VNLDSDTILVHQVHPVKLAFDISASVISNLLLWRHTLAAGSSHGVFFDPISTDR
jgi:hypothetical protein